MGKAIEIFKESLEKATSSNGPDSLHAATAIAVNADGSFPCHLLRVPSLFCSDIWVSMTKENNKTNEQCLSG
jgi:hypothetical protein